ncbi:hypothetical protein [Streptomyces sp. NPDC052179]|uniref:hypothetical protein n=1 Tax=Streptomyces sp. NPDC052179 TaxID=3155680 RepID=UPI003440EC8A
MRATIRTQNATERAEDAKAAAASITVDKDATYKVRMSHSEPGLSTREDTSTLPGTSVPGLIAALLKSIDDEIEQDGTGRITCWAIDPDTGAEDRQVFTAA